MKSIVFSIVALLVLFQVNVRAQDTELVSKKQKIPAWLNIALGDANQLEGGLHVYQNWATYNSDFKISRVKTGMLIAIVDPAGDGSLPSKLYQLKTWATPSVIPEQNEWEEFSTAALPDGTADGATLRWNSSGWEESTALVNDSTDIVISGKLTLGNDTIDSAGIIRLADGDTTTTDKVAIQAPDSLRTTYSLTLPDSLGKASQVLATDENGKLSWTTPFSFDNELDTTLTLVKRLTSDDTVDVVLNLKTLPRVAQFNLAVGTGTGLGFAIPASSKFNDTEEDSVFVGDVNKGALVHTAMIAARKATDSDSDLDTDLAFYTRKDGKLDKRLVVGEEGERGITISGNLTVKDTVNKALIIPLLKLKMTDSENKVDLLKGNGVGIDMNIPLNGSETKTTARIAAVRSFDTDTYSGTQLSFQTRYFNSLEERMKITEDGSSAITQTVKGEEDIGIALDLRGLPFDNGTDLKKSTSGIALGFTIPASNVWETTSGINPDPYDSAYVGGLNEGALTQTAMIAARRTASRDNDLDTELGFYTRKDGVLAPQFVINDDGSYTLEGDTVDDNQLILKVARLTNDHTITFPNATGTVALSDNISATGNIKLNSHYLSNEGQDNGLKISNSGNATLSGLIRVFGGTVRIDDKNSGMYGDIETNTLTTTRTVKIPDKDGTIALTSELGPFSTTSNVTSNTAGNLASDDFVFGSDTLDYDGDTSHASRMFFDKSKGAFRAGSTDASHWDEISVGDHSVAFGDNTEAAGSNSMAAGESSIANGSASVAIGSSAYALGSGSIALGDHVSASGFYTVALGSNTKSISLASTAIGTYNIGGGTYNSWIATDPLFEIGNGTSDANRSNALTVYKNGNTDINGNLTVTDTINAANGIIKGTNGEYIKVGTTNGYLAFYNDGDDGIVFSVGTSGDPQMYGYNNSAVTGLTVASNLTVDGTIYNPSDRRLKKNIETLTGTLDAVKQLRGVSFNFKDTAAYAKGKQFGLIAQELQQVLPELVDTGSNGYLKVNYLQLVPVLLQALKEQQGQMELLEGKMAAISQQKNTSQTAALQQENETLKGQLKDLEAKMNILMEQFKTIAENK